MGLAAGHSCAAAVSVAQRWRIRAPLCAGLTSWAGWFHFQLRRECTLVMRNSPAGARRQLSRQRTRDVHDANLSGAKGHGVQQGGLGPGRQPAPGTSVVIWRMPRIRRGGQHGRRRRAWPGPCRVLDQGWHPQLGSSFQPDSAKHQAHKQPAPRQPCTSTRQSGAHLQE